MNLQIKFMFSNALKCLVFLEAGLAKWRRQKTLGPLQNTLKQLGKKKKNKQTKERVVEQMCVDNTPVDLSESDNLLISDSPEESLSTSLLLLSSSQIFTEPFFYLDSIFFDNFSEIRDYSSSTTFDPKLPI